MPGLRTNRAVRRMIPRVDGLPDRCLPSGLGHGPAAVAADVAPAAAATMAGRGWAERAPLPVGQAEVAAAAVGGEIVVLGGAVASGATTARVEAFSPRLDRWRALPDLPVALNHAMAASDGRRLYVVGGYAGNPGPQTVSAAGFVLDRGTWRPLPAMPDGRAAGGAALVGNRLYVVGGVTPRGLAETSLVLNLRTGRWSEAPGPTPREHLGVAVAGGRIYAVGGRTAGFDSNLDVVESYRPGAGGWNRLPPVPEARGGTGAAVVGNRLVSAGGERTEGTIASVFAYNIARRRWTRLPDLPTPRHGMGVVALGNRVFAIGGGEVTGGGASTRNEVLRIA